MVLFSVGSIMGATDRDGTEIGTVVWGHISVSGLTERGLNEVKNLFVVGKSSRGCTEM